MLRAGGTLESVQWISIATGITALGLLWLGLRRALPADPIARAVALLLAAVLPCAIHVQGMLGNEALLAPFVLGAMLLIHKTTRSAYSPPRGLTPRAARAWSAARTRPFAVLACLAWAWC